MASVVTTRPFRPLPVPQALGFGLKARYTPVENVPTLFDHKFLVDRYSPKRAAVTDYYSRLAPDVLRWRVISNASAKKVPKAVLRNRLKRRWASAFAEALKRAGYYHNGRKRSGPKDGKNYIPGLKGTLEILVYSERGITCPHGELVGACGALLKSLQRKKQHMENARYDSAPEKKSGEDSAETDSTEDVPASLWSLWGGKLF
ncbi:uncharacterized protein Z520_10031 [Fonsecaea multimorphosa CBS 102226]|uniref:Uncharacterized protein n=1 Tax=Fonsecaea multimorphosa CBS 102226 TaxID=1442371 RepID=A0A0D2IAZ4_9EURO|nr:uncharacterized protein Z520_10031 [Fonsecaea multimorphosa CBS 102226]KIX94321.1 hypothetical protein Z520_10031 [Fonsecaea multimorphosa CBS 102226]OAL19655.1 hypothetical protein AYO22_09527 [Fonsecaea multimorphosa]